ncbi:hypothetical protein DFJ73DRAFT_966469, partial [Zopfochytrium polystomum]
MLCVRLPVLVALMYPNIELHGFSFIFFLVARQATIAFRMWFKVTRAARSSQPHPPPGVGNCAQRSG